MYSESAALYDLIYASFKDYAAEARHFAELLRRIRPQCRTLLDVACGTGAHARLLGEAHGFAVDGIDLDPALVAIARAKCPQGKFAQADMVDFHLGRSYDAVLCLFGSIGYAVTLPRLRQAVACLAAHVAPGGLVVVEPFLTPEQFVPGTTGQITAEAPDLRVTRTHRSERTEQACRLHFEYEIERPAGTEYAAEVHELGLFTVDEMLESFAAAGLAARHEPDGPIGRGIYVATAG